MTTTLSGTDKRRFALEALADDKPCRRKAIYEQVAKSAGVPYDTLASHGYILQDLRSAGLVERPSRGIYRITRKGCRWLQCGVPLTKSNLIARE